MTTAMDNLGTVRRSYNVLGRERLEGIPPLIGEICDPGFVFSAAPLGGDFEGEKPAEGWIDTEAYFEALAKRCGEINLLPTDVEVVSGGVFVVATRVTPEDRERTDVGIEKFSAVFQFLDGLISHVTLYPEQKEAMDAAKKAEAKRALAEADVEDVDAGADA